MKEQIYSMIGMYIRHSRIYAQNRMISDTVGYKMLYEMLWGCSGAKKIPRIGGLI